MPNSAFCALRQWEPLPDVGVYSHRDARSPEALLAILDALDVTRNPRYAPVGSTTRCNALAQDYCQLMGVILPRVWLFGPDIEHDADHWDEMGANKLFDWLLRRGPSYGWRASNGSLEAMNYAMLGHPALVSYRNPDPSRSGHIAVVRPSKLHPVAIEQAGAKCLSDANIAEGFGGLPVSYFIND